MIAIGQVYRSKKDPSHTFEITEKINDYWVIFSKGKSWRVRDKNMEQEVAADWVLEEKEKLMGVAIRPLGSLPAHPHKDLKGFPAFDVRKFLSESKVVEIGDAYLVEASGYYNHKTWDKHELLPDYESDYEYLNIGDWIVYDGKRWVRVSNLNDAIPALIGDGAITYQKDDSATKEFMKALFEL